MENRKAALIELSEQINTILKVIRPVSLMAQMDSCRCAEGAVYTALMQARAKIGAFLTACDDKEYDALPEDVREDMN